VLQQAKFAWVNSVLVCCGETPSADDKARFLDKLGAANLQDIETCKCCWRRSALQGAQVFH